MDFDDEVAANRNSDRFDAEWYLNQYPDVKMLGMDPLQHYLWIGKRLGRSIPKTTGSPVEQPKSITGGALDRPRDPWRYFMEPMPGIPNEKEGVITRLMHYIWASRPDLRQLFDLSTRRGRSGLRNWYLGSFEREYGLPPEPPQLTDERILDPRGANLIGYAKGELGMGEHVRMVASSLDALDVPFDVVNVAAGNHGEEDSSINRWISERQRFATNIFHINADMMPVESLKFGQGFYNIGYWAWELPNCPPQFDAALSVVDEIWACSEFTADAFRTRAEVPVISMPLAVEVPELSDRQFTKAHYGLPQDKFIYFFTFDALSMIDRKNPIGIVRAFNSAFPRGDEPVHLALKAMNTQYGGVLWKLLLDEIGDSARITLFDRRFSKEETLGLNLACDAFVSLHRSEGFGRCLAEAMSYGKPVIATNYSGSCEFVHEETACPIDYKLVPVPEDSYPNSQDSVWADPDLDHASWAMRKLFDDEAFRRTKGLAGRQYIRENFNRKAIGERYKRRLEAIRQLSGGTRNQPIVDSELAQNAKDYVGSNKTVLFTITSKNYVSYARTVLKSVAKIHPEYALFLCLADEPGEDFDLEGEPFMVVPASSLGIPCFSDMTLRYDVLEFNTAVKPFMFRWVYESTDADRVIYFDPDLHLYSRLDDLTAHLDAGASAVLTPHITEPLIDDGRNPDDRAMLQAGVFNLGFIATRRCDESEKFIRWWGEKLRTDARVDLANGLFTDQKWCDLAPCFMPNLKVLHDPGYNVAYWNLAQRSVSRANDGTVTVNGRPLVFFHFSGINPKNLEPVSKHQDRFRWEDISTVCRELFVDYASTLLANDWEGALKYPYAYDQIEGLEIQSIMRRTYSAHNVKPRDFASAQDAKKYLIQICNQPSELSTNDRHSISELMLQVHRLRPDLQAVFNLASTDGRTRFRKWFAESAAQEYRLTPIISGVD